MDAADKIRFDAVEEMKGRGKKSDDIAVIVVTMNRFWESEIERRQRVRDEQAAEQAVAQRAADRAASEKAAAAARTAARKAEAARRQRVRAEQAAERAVAKNAAAAAERARQEARDAAEKAERKAHATARRKEAAAAAANSVADTSPPLVFNFRKHLFMFVTWPKASVDFVVSTAVAALLAALKSEAASTTATNRYI